MNQKTGNQTLNKQTISFIGAGNMSTALIQGIQASNMNISINIADPDEVQRLNIQAKFPKVNTFENNRDAIQTADIIVLAVKPQIMRVVCEDLARNIPEHALVISIAAGITLNNLTDWLKQELAIIRCMPNTPALVNAGMSGLYANAQVNTEQRQLGQQILDAVGQTIWVENENEINAVTAVSGSGPAYFFLVMEAMQTAAIELGLNQQQAETLVLQTAVGAAKLAQDSELDVTTLRENVTSKGGTTEAAINILLEEQLPDSFDKALQAAYQRAIELSE